MTQLVSHRTARHMFLATAALGSLAALPAQASQNTDAQSPAPAATSADATGDILVTARRRAERLIDAPVAITALSGDALDNYAVTEFSDMAASVPTMVVGRAGSGSSASIFLRGVGSSSLSAGFDQSVSFVVDGIPMSRGREISLSQYDVDRVEVLKGPQALFYGKNATGGLIALSTRGPTDEFEAGFKAGYGFKAREKYGEGYVSGPMGENFAGRLAFRLSDSDGSLTNTAADTYLDPLGMERHRNSSRRGGGRTYSGRVTLEWTPSDTFTVQAKGGYTDHRDGGASDLLERICGAGRTIPQAANGIPPSPNADCRVDGRTDNASIPRAVAEANYRYAGDGRMYSHLKSGFGVLTATISSDVFDVTSITSYYRFRQTDLTNVSGEGYPAGFSQLADYRQLAEELRFQSSWGGPISLLFGAFAANSKFTFNTDAYIMPVPISTITGTYKAFSRDNGFSGDTLSAFGEVTLDLGDMFELAGGARWSWESRNSFQQSLPAHEILAAAFPPHVRLEDRYRESNISPQATLRFKPAQDVTLYAAYKEGFKSGGFNISQSITPATTVADGQFGAEKARGGELGLKTLLLDGSLALNATAYLYDYRDLQVQTYDPVTQGLIVGNAGSLRVKGIEADFSWRLGDFSLHGAAAYNQAKYRDYIGQCYPGQTIAEGCTLLAGPTGDFTSQDYAGRTPPKAPRFGGRLGAAYDAALSDSGWRLLLTGDVNYTSSYNFTDTLRPDGVQKRFAKIDASVRLNAPESRWSISLIGRNLTNRLTVSSANDIPFTGGTGTGTSGPGTVADMSAMVEHPREIFLELGVRF